MKDTTNAQTPAIAMTYIHDRRIPWATAFHDRTEATFQAEEQHAYYVLNEVGGIRKYLHAEDNGRITVITTKEQKWMFYFEERLTKRLSKAEGEQYDGRRLYSSVMPSSRVKGALVLVCTGDAEQPQAQSNARFDHEFPSWTWFFGAGEGKELNGSSSFVLSNELLGSECWLGCNEDIAVMKQTKSADTYWYLEYAKLDALDEL